LVAEKAGAFSLSTTTVVRAKALVANKYASQAWLERA
jgi:hypothetical protein